MSRIGKKPITVPAGVEVKVEDANLVTVKGPKGTLVKKLHQDMIIKQDAGVITIELKNEEQNIEETLPKSIEELDSTKSESNILNLANETHLGLIPERVFCPQNGR